MLVNTAVTENQSGAGGGGIINGGLLTLTNSTVSNNVAGGGNGDGGGIITESSDTVTLINSTLSGNLGYRGGAIWIRTAQVQLTNVTVANNSGTLAGGIFNESGTITLKNTIIANNSPGGDCSGSIASTGHNLDSDGTCSLGATGDISSQLPLLGPLQNNGGPTFTHALLEGSPAIDAADDANCPSADQRGIPRPQEAACDIGAFER